MPCILNFFVIVSFLYTVAPVLFSRSKWKCIATMARLASYLLYRFFLKRKSQVYLYCSLLLVNTTKTAQSSLYFVENFYACVCYFNLLDSTSDLKKELPRRTVAIHKRFRVLFSFVSILQIFLTSKLCFVWWGANCVHGNRSFPSYALAVDTVLSF